MDPTPQDYRPTDEATWLECRVLAFLPTAYFDDVVTRKSDPRDAVQLVVRDGERVVGLLDASVDGPDATIDSVAVHPAYQGRGLGTRLFEETVRRVRALGVTTLDAWTRDDEPTLRWYAGRGFVESDHYLHVYLDDEADDLAPDVIDAVRAAAGVRVVKAFAHAPLDREQELRARYHRVHVCRRMSLGIATGTMEA